MPHYEHFYSPTSYYYSLYHEIIHSTGHPTRLARYTTGGSIKFGSEVYSREELVAEIGAAFLAAEVNLASDIELTSSAAYLSGWAKVLQENQRWIVIAASQAQRAADYVLGRTWAEDGDGGMVMEDKDTQLPPALAENP